MGKSLRNKKKVAARTQKRTDSFYAVHHAARLQRLSSKLQSGGDAEVKEDEMKVDGEAVKGEEKEEGVKAQVVKTEDDGTSWTSSFPNLTAPTSSHLNAFFPAPSAFLLKQPKWKLLKRSPPPDLA
jgi:hypothetical protein